MTDQAKPPAPMSQCPVCGHRSEDFAGYLAHYRLTHGSQAKKEKAND